MSIWCATAFCQDQALPIEEWIEKLSVRKDPHGENLMDINARLINLDSAGRCSVMLKLMEESHSRNPRLRIRISMLKNSISQTFDACPQVTYSIDEAKEMLRLAYELEDQQLIAVTNRMIATNYRLAREFGLAVMHLMIALEIQNSSGTSHYGEITADHYALGEMLYHSREYRAAINAFQKSLESSANPRFNSSDTLNDITRMFLFNTLGLSYEKIHLYDSAFYAFNEALRYSRNYHDVTWAGLIQGNRGDIFFQLGQYDSAEALLTLDVQRSLNSGKLWSDNAANSMQWLARIKTIRGNPHEALVQLGEANKKLKELPNPAFQANIYYAYMQAYEKLGRADSLYLYTQKYLTLHDSIERKAADDRAEVVTMRLDNQANIYKITELNKEKKRIALIRNFIIAFTLLGTAFGILYINRQKLKMHMRQQKAMDEKAKAEAEAEAARKQLSIFTQHIIEKNSLVEKLQEKLFEREMNESQIQSISELSQHTILTDEDWDRFKSLFEKVYPGFFRHLKDLAPDITLAEQRMAALSKLHVTTKEASNMLGISPASVNKTKQRLRSRLSLDSEIDLDAFFAAY